MLPSQIDASRVWANKYVCFQSSGIFRLITNSWEICRRRKKVVFAISDLFVFKSLDCSRSDSIRKEMFVHERRENVRAFRQFTLLELFVFVQLRQLTTTTPKRISAKHEHSAETNKTHINSRWGCDRASSRLFVRFMSRQLVCQMKMQSTRN